MFVCCCCCCCCFDILEEFSTKPLDKETLKLSRKKSIRDKPNPSISHYLSLSLAQTHSQRFGCTNTQTHTSSCLSLSLSLTHTHTHTLTSFQQLFFVLCQIPFFWKTFWQLSNPETFEQLKFYSASKHFFLSLALSHSLSFLTHPHL